MKYSIITVCYNSENTIKDTIESVKAQKDVNVEHIIVDGLSKDRTANLIKDMLTNKMIFLSEPDLGLYDAMNKGLRLATGDVIGILNSDDFFSTDDVLLEVNKNFKNDVDIVFGNVEFIENNIKQRVTRKIALRNFKPWFLKFGWMPPHTGTFLRRKIISAVGDYDISYETAADYEYFIRVFYKYKFSYKYINKTIVKMREGGLTTNGIQSYMRTGKEMVRAIRSNGYYSNAFMILCRLPIKLLNKKFFFRRL